MALLEIKNLSFTYPDMEKPAIKDINLSVNEGEFVVVCGPSGCGKTTLLRLLKRQLRPNGKLCGEILYMNRPEESLSERQSVTEIGFVMQNPENQTVTDKVWHELAFGLESIGEKTPQIRRKIAEISSFFGISKWYHKRTSELSGGQKQLLCLASVMVMNPKVLILDEPTAQLDPIAASEFIATLKRINEETGMTIILVEHRLEEVFSVAHKLVIMDNGSILTADTPKEVGKRVATQFSQHSMFSAMPSSVRIFRGLDIQDIECPINVREGREFICNNFENKIRSLERRENNTDEREIAISLKEGFFRYEKDTPDVLDAIDLDIYAGEFLCILGENGSGKTTLLRVLSGLRRLYKGKYRLWGKKIKEYNTKSLYRNNIASLPQNPQLLFVKNRLYDDLKEVTTVMEYDKKQADEAIRSISARLGISHLLENHPYDLSGGEQQKAAIAKILLMNPSIILLDEPTKGIDAASKITLAKILKNLQNDGKTVVMVTHDVEFAAQYADRCAMFFDGQIVSSDVPYRFFAENTYYTTAASRISRNFFDGAVTVDEVVALCRMNNKKSYKGDSAR